MLATRHAFGQRVLVCDEERYIVKLLQASLRRQGYELFCAYDGREAIMRLEAQPFDQAILDLKMPDLDG